MSAWDDNEGQTQWNNNELINLRKVIDDLRQENHDLRNKIDYLKSEIEEIGYDLRWTKTELSMERSSDPEYW